MTIFFREKVLLVKPEVTYGTDPVPTAAANSILAIDMKIMPMEGRDQSRELDMPSMGAQPTIPLDLHSKMSFKVELQPSGVAGTAPAWGPLVRACGCAQTIVAATSVTYTPVSSGHESATIYFYIGQTLYKIIGARGTAKFTVNAQGIAYIEFTFTGLFTAAAQGVRPTPVVTAFQKPLAVSSTNTPVFTVNGVALVMRTFALDMGNEIVPRFLVNSHQVLITDRAEMIDMTVEAEALTLINPYALAAAQTMVAIVLHHGTVAGARLKLHGGICQIQRPSGVENSQGIVEWPLRAVPIQNVGNDQWALILD